MLIVFTRGLIMTEKTFKEQVKKALIKYVPDIDNTRLEKLTNSIYDWFLINGRELKEKEFEKLVKDSLKEA